MREEVLVVAKTYPNLSKKYDETVCVAGINKIGDWIRLYPIRFRQLPQSRQFSKFDVINAEVKKANEKFMRRESHKVEDDSIKIIGGLPVSKTKVGVSKAKENWDKRKEILTSKQDKSLESLESEKMIKRKSIGIIKPKKIIDFFKKNVDECRDWEKDLIDGTQKTLFGEYQSPLDKIPYWMGYHFFCDDKNCKGHKMMCEDWEMLQLFRSMRQKYGSDEEAFQKVKEKYLEWMQTRDLYFVVGTESRFNKFLIISIFYPPK